MGLRGMVGTLLLVFALGGNAAQAHHRRDIMVLRVVIAQLSLSGILARVAARRARGGSGTTQFT